jgi:hypothetical protein
MRSCGVPTIIGTMVLLTAAVLAGCQSTDAVQPNSAALDEATCPEEIQDRVRVAGSAVPLEIPAELAQGTGATGHDGQLARRAIVSVSPKPGAQGAKVLSSTLTMITVGGVFAGWARLDQHQESTKALDVIPGRLRIEPFLNSKSLRAQTMTVDLLVKPGSTPLDELAITTTPLWSEEQRPARPEDLRLTFSPIRHMTVFDEVDANVTLDVTAVSAHRFWRCSFVSRIELVDRASVLPDLWGLRETGTEKQWLALNDPTTGPFRAVFTNPEAARGFMDWLRATRATRVDKYSLGLFQLETPPDSHTPRTANSAVAPLFHAISQEEAQALGVKRLGE